MACPKMDLKEELKLKGWHLTNEGLELCKEGLDRITVTSLIQKALDLDLRDIGGNFFPEDINRGKLDNIFGSGVVQIQKIKNASAPKYEYCSGAPAILRLLLTDGIIFVNCLQWGNWKSITMDTPPGTKIFLKPGKINMQNNFLLLNENQFTVLGGCVAPMVEKWELCRRLASHVRTNEDRDGGPPPWIPFGKPIITGKSTKTGLNFRSLDPDVKEAKENAVFKQQRMANIAEVSKAKEGKTKVFGGGKEKPPSKNETSHHYLNATNNFTAHEKSKNMPESSNDSTQSPSKSHKYNPERTYKTYRNSSKSFDQQVQRTHSPNNGISNPGQSYYQKSTKRPDIKYKNNSNNSYNKSTSSFQQRDSDKGNDYRNSKKLSKNSYFENDWNSSSNNKQIYNEANNNFEDIVNKTSRISLHGYEDRVDRRKNIVPDKAFLKPGVEVMAKYWEDNKYYPAVVHAVGQEGTTCVVHFTDYGNYEEVLVNDVQPLKSEWKISSLSNQPNYSNNSELTVRNKDQNYNGILDFQPRTSKPHFQNRGWQDRQKSSHSDFRYTKVYNLPHE